MKPKAAKWFSITHYDPDKHGAWVRSIWAHGALRDGSAAARAKLDELLARHGSWAIVAHPHGMPDRYVGWAARTQDALIFAYVLPLMRRRGIATLLFAEMGYTERPIPLLHWTPSAQRIAASAGTVYHAMYNLEVVN